MGHKIKKTDKEWREQLTSEQFRVTRQKGTERAFTGEYDHLFSDGTYYCVCCGQALFSSQDKFDSGCGWPSFSQSFEPNSVDTQLDVSFNMIRTEVNCPRCDSHLGHVFDDGPPPTGKRYCINSVALKFRPSKK